MQVKAGEMKWLIDIESRVLNTDVSGGQNESFTTLHQTWAKKEESSRVSSGSDESFEDGQILATNTAYFTVWYIDGLSTDMQIDLESQKYDILHVQEIGQRAQQRIRAIHRSNT